MLNGEKNTSPAVAAVLVEISEALERFIATGETWNIFTNKMSLTADDREILRDFLGTGSIRIQLTDSDEPAEWVESAVAGVWYGVFYDRTHNPVLETIEIGAFPQVPAAQVDDVKSSLQILQQRL